MLAVSLPGETLQRLLEAGRSIVAELDVQAVLERVLRTAAEVTDARYAALGVLGEDRRELERFLTYGISEQERRALGPLPRGHGLLGALISDPRPLRRDTLDTRNLPAGHPEMRTFLGVPILVRGEAWGNLYLCEKADGGRFTDADEDAVVVLAEWASIAIDNARLYERSEERREQLQRAVHRLEATTAIARAVGGETELDRILELIVERGRTLLDARGLLILLRGPRGLAVAAGAGDVPAGVRGRTVGRDDRVEDALGLASAGGVLVPLAFRGRSLGMLVAFETPGAGDDESLLQAFAASAATAVATARTVEEERLHEALRAAESERHRWARELHDETLQGLGALRMLLTAAVRSDDPETLRAGVRDCIGRLEGEIDGLRGLIRDLRPAALDELGLAAAIEGLASRVAERERLDVTARVDVPHRHDPALETAVYRVVQEAVTNAVRHSGAGHVEIQVRDRGELIELHVSDDGRGFDPDAPENGYGLSVMRERVALLRGELEITSSPEGTTIDAALPLGAYE